MAKKILIVTVISCIVAACSTGLQAQTSEPFVRPGMIRAHLTFSPGYLFSGEPAQMYLHGSLEGFLNQKISLAGESYYYLGTLSGEKGLFSDNHSVFYGCSYHFTRGNSDLFVGLQPGCSITKARDEEESLYQNKMAVDPLFSTVAGYNLYVWKLLHFFVHVRYVTGEHNHDIHASLSEIRASAGLGWNVNLIRQKKMKRSS